jgi:hypothetical protein
MPISLEQVWKVRLASLKDCRRAAGADWLQSAWERLNQLGKGFSMRTLVLSAFAATAGLVGAAVALSSASAQTQAQPCGMVAYSQAEQKYVGVPCNAPAGKTSDGKDCGPVAYSVAEQKYVGIPCNATSGQKTSDGKDCGAVAYSVAEQKYVGVPCPTK